jgi:hypothetical protein
MRMEAKFPMRQRLARASTRRSPLVMAETAEWTGARPRSSTQARQIGSKYGPGPTSALSHAVWRILK